ncbi:hypothetical protein TNCV_2282921 [Trichonephila clavipes]|uniref:Uncharacterized protein n=1 Tax=Trichonephila clavipes TaxID=2585209 RepID=A0A8X6RBE1_TRICX|nr:hypothetical protein TNCV_2282921 [Trichonephila clavipes]
MTHRLVPYIPSFHNTPMTNEVRTQLNCLRQCQFKLISNPGRRSMDRLGIGGSNPAYLCLSGAPAPSTQWINRHWPKVQFFESSRIYSRNELSLCERRSSIFCKREEELDFLPNKNTNNGHLDSMY